MGIDKSDKEELIRFLGHIGDDFCEDEKVTIWAECEAGRHMSVDDDSCPDHQDCGICRYEYMKAKGWLIPESKLTI